MAAKKGATAGTPFRVKVKKVGKAKKSFGPKEQKPKKYVGQGRLARARALDKKKGSACADPFGLAIETV